MNGEEEYEEDDEFENVRSDFRKDFNEFEDADDFDDDWDW